MTTKVSSTKSSPITEPKAEKDEERMKAKLEFIKHAGGQIEEFNPISDKLKVKSGQKRSTGKRHSKGHIAHDPHSTAGDEDNNDIVDDSEMSQEEIKLREFVKDLRRRTKYTEKEIRMRYTEFLEHCPEGLLSKKKFMEVSKQALGSDAAFVTDTIFKVFDEDKDGKLNFAEYMMAMSASTLNTPEDKLRWIFKMYDKNRTGRMESEELTLMFTTLFSMSNVSISTVQMEMLVTDVLQTLDEDGSGDIDVEEFVVGCAKTPYILNLLCPDHVNA